MNTLDGYRRHLREAGINVVVHLQSMVLSVIAITDRVQYAGKALGPGDHKHYFRRCGANPQSRHLQRAAPRWLAGQRTLAREVGKDGVTAVLLCRADCHRRTRSSTKQAKREGRSVEDVSAEGAGSIP